MNTQLSHLITQLTSSSSAAADPPGSSCPAGSDPGKEEEGAEVLLANSLWSGRGTPLLPAYVESMQGLFHATASVGSADDVNKWAATATRGLITEAIPPGSEFDAVLANALHFKGKWEHAFEKARTHAAPFQTGDGKEVQVRNGPVFTLL